jgi:hypothetical protein
MYAHRLGGRASTLIKFADCDQHKNVLKLFYNKKRTPSPPGGRRESAQCAMGGAGEASMSDERDACDRNEPRSPSEAMPHTAYK